MFVKIVSVATYLNRWWSVMLMDEQFDRSEAAHMVFESTNFRERNRHANNHRDSNYMIMRNLSPINLETIITLKIF